MRKILFIFAFVMMFFSAAHAVSIQNAYGALFKADLSEEDVKKAFAPEFLKQIPVAEIQRIVKIYLETLGEFKQIDEKQMPMVARFDKGTTQTTIGFDGSGKINTLWFGAPVISQDNLKEVLDLFQKLEGKVSVCLLKNNEDEIIAIKADEELAVGSTFKLFILKALADEVSEGKRHWHDIVKINRQSKSFPSGILHDWPEGTSLTLESMAALMISLSDNTATDHLFNLLGREEMSRVFPQKCKPAFNTMDMFRLKLFFPDSGKEFVGANQEQKAEILSRLSKINREDIASAAKIFDWSEPKMIDSLEWFISTRQLCQTIFSLRESSLIAINPANGLVDAKDWEKAGFKGGSEPGVLNYTWVLQPKNDSDFYCLSCTINNSEKAINNSDFDLAVSRLLKLIAKKKLEAH